MDKNTTTTESPYQALLRRREALKLQKEDKEQLKK